jgi:hypothetical protein
MNQKYITYDKIPDNVKSCVIGMWRMGAHINIIWAITDLDNKNQIKRIINRYKTNHQ